MLRYKVYYLGVSLSLLFSFLTGEVFSACGTVWSAAATWNGLNWGVGATRYTLGFAVEHGGTEYTVKAIPGFNCAPDDATHGATYWNTIGPCGTPPTVSATTAAGSIDCNSATSGGTVDSDGDGSGIAVRGIIYSQTSGAEVGDAGAAVVNDAGTTTGAFGLLTMTPLESGKTYYARAYAQNNTGDYGYDDAGEISFVVDIQTVTATDAVGSITTSTATSGGTVGVDGGETITERGLIYSKSSGAEVGDAGASTVTTAGTTGAFGPLTMTGMDGNTLYYVQAYATNACGTVYGPERSFGTHNPPTVATQTTADVFCEAFSTGLNTSVKGNAYGSPVGTATLSGFGIIYGTDEDDVDDATVSNPLTATVEPHIANNASSIITGLRYQKIMGLSAATTYYYKAYSTNQYGTGYGSTNNVTTSAACPVYYSCSAFETYDTDPACPSAASTPTSASIVYMRHDWRVSTGTALDEMEDLADAAVVNHFTATPYRIVVQDGGFVYRTNNFNSGTELVIQAGGQFGFNGSLNLIVDLVGSAGPELASVSMEGGSFLSRSGFTNNIKISSGTGEICYKGSFSNTLTAPGSIYENYDIAGSWPSTGYTDGNCTGTFVLPVELLSFVAKKESSDCVVLDWVTGAEIDNQFFEVQSSVDGRVWEVVSIVPGAGNSTSALPYNATDCDLGGLSKKYYRLKQVDFDGSYSFSKVKVVSFDKGKGITNCYDDGSRIIVTFEGELGQNSFELIDAQGKVVAVDLFVQEGSDGFYRFTIPKNESISRGLNFIRLNTSFGSYSSKVVVR